MSWREPKTKGFPDFWKIGRADGNQRKSLPLTYMREARKNTTSSIRCKGDYKPKSMKHNQIQTFVSIMSNNIWKKKTKVQYKIRWDNVKSVYLCCDDLAVESIANAKWRIQKILKLLNWLHSLLADIDKHLLESSYGVLLLALTWLMHIVPSLGH